jgi:large subunit ribosomal protein L29
MKPLAALDPAQYDTKIAELKRSLFDLRVKQAIHQLEKPSRLRDIRRDVARIETLKRKAAKPAASK